MTEIWQDRKTKSGYERAGDLAKRYNRRNYRKHPALQRSIVENSLDRLGWLGSVKQGANNVIFDGHLRVELALVKFGPDALVPVDYYNLTPEETDQALLIHDTTTGMADIDFVMLDTLWKETPDLEIPEFDLWLGDFLTGSSQNGSGGNGINDPYQEWQGMPEFNQEDKTAYQSIHVHFQAQKDVEDFARLINQKITEQTRYIWFPYIEIERYADKRYSDES